jgi:16S rRNA (guanine966-N2)-methyltransferase
MEKKFAKNNDDLPQKFMRGDRQDQQKRASRNRWSSSSCGSAVSARAGSGAAPASDARPLDNEIWLDERMRRQKKHPRAAAQGPAGKTEQGRDHGADAQPDQGNLRPFRGARAQGLLRRLHRQATIQLILTAIRIATPGAESPRAKAHAGLDRRLQVLAAELAADRQNSCREIAQLWTLAQRGACYSAAHDFGCRHAKETRQSPGPPVPAAQQVRIIGGAWKRTPLPVLDALGLRPTPDRVRETVFNWINHLRDATGPAPTASTCSPAAARSASRRPAAAPSSVTMIDTHTPGGAPARGDQGQAQRRQREMLRADALARRATMGLRGQRFDLMFLDPPYQQDFLAKALPLCAAAQGGRPGLRRIRRGAAVRAGRRRPDWLAPWEAGARDKAGMVFFHLLKLRKAARKNVRPTPIRPPPLQRGSCHFSGIMRVLYWCISREPQWL